MTAARRLSDEELDAIAERVVQKIAERRLMRGLSTAEPSTGRVSPEKLDAARKKALAIDRSRRGVR